MESLLAILAEARIRPQLASLLKQGDECVLVGGALRDWLLGRPVTDFDFATPEDPTLLAQRFAKLIGGSWFVLDPLRRQSRVVHHHAGETRTYDFAPYRGTGIEADLRGRDFTINSLALPIESDGRPVLHDPLGGRRDLERELLRDCSPTAFRDDPLRVLRGVRHAVVLGFGFKTKTFSRMHSAAPLVRKMAPERIRGELAAIFSSPPVGHGLTLLDELGLCPDLFGGPSRPEGVGEGIRLASAVEMTLSRLGQVDAGTEIVELCRQELADGFTRAALLKFAGFLRGYGPSEPVETLQKRLRLSRRNLGLVRRLLELPTDLAAGLPALPAGRARALWAESLGPSPSDGLLFLTVFDRILMNSPELLLSTLRDHRAARRRGRIPDLVDGRWLRERLGITEGPAIGALLEDLRRAEVDGEVRTVEEAQSYLCCHAKKMVDKEGSCSYNP